MAFVTLHCSLGVLLVFLSVLVTAYLYMTRNFNYWKKRGVNEIRPVPFFGNFLDCCLFRMASSVKLGSIYERGKDLPYLGFYIFDKPSLVLRDPEIIKGVLMTDFNYFIDRHVSTHESDTIAAANIFLLNSPKWRTVRQTVSPIFTAAKTQNMFHMMLEIGKDLDTHLEALPQGDVPVVDVKEICVKYTTDVITSCAFGLQGNALNDPNAAFKKCGRSIFGAATHWRCAEFAAFFFFPGLVKLLNLNFYSTEASIFMRKTFLQTMNMRMENNVFRNDLIDLLIRVKKSQNKTDDPNGFEFDDNSLLGQAAMFFAAGFETSSNALSFALYELGLHTNIQSRLREEITSALEENEGEITYRMIMNLPYLDMCVSEVLRKYPSVPFVERVAFRDYEVPGTDLLIEKGTPVYVPLLGLHYDPQYYPEPDKFDPERFNNENKRERPTCVYMPFGLGPRNCIGLRLALLVVKFGIVKLILKYEFTACEETLIPMRFDQKATLLAMDGGLYLRARRIATAMEN